ncbi:MAG: PTS fructose transporter subunit IIA [Proteobacteria bacterium]|jgi:PTS system mannose-specific IIA component|nr:PTS fructose transporter subunit IIA [Pseudomonadota bacterium]
MNTILLIAHDPLARALREGALHVFPEAADQIVAVDVSPQAAPDDTLTAARAALDRLPADGGVLILTDLFGATPCNVAQRLADGQRTRVLAGVSLPTLLRAVSYRHEPLEVMLEKAISGGMQGIMQVGVTAPQNQTLRTATHDQERDHHQQ